ncbi:MAG: hypothetical protein BWY70_01846 [Bacteroidetes bacterium ADurb.Bin408]|nr:MAG: hypothetical protein BWY70_01846 [Bacteroidetes bacterium ADurb.Bin408]
MQKAATDKVFAQVLNFRVGKNYIAMAGHVHKRVVENFGTTCINNIIFRRYSSTKVFIAELNEIC